MGKDRLCWPGIMGLPVAQNLITAGYTLTVNNLHPGPERLLAEQGARLAFSAREVAEQRGIIVTMLPDSPQVEGAGRRQGGAGAPGPGCERP